MGPGQTMSINSTPSDTDYILTTEKKNLQTAPSANQANPELDNAIRP